MKIFFDVNAYHLDIRYWLLAIGYWLLAIGYWLLAIGYWLFNKILCLIITKIKITSVRFPTYTR
jgi:hypothetical protein